MFGAIGGVTACAAVYSGHPNSFPCSSLGGSGSGSTFEFISTEISLPNGRGQKAICGNLKLTQQIGYKLIKIDTKKLDNWHYYAIVVELQGHVTNAKGEKSCTYLRQLLPETNSGLICRSKIFSLVSGQENGLDWQNILQKMGCYGIVQILNSPIFLLTPSH
ncbi:uncharacterized protein LOC110850213 [Folsomia candida]|uniref:uncharacterized protein LOC110850213 n=1 Tax=Folsomia candida TaxID=158441 RepID=UPI0016053848|nr:uncharacterized protein LOC110850213 [Folsomia candida]